MGWKACKTGKVRKIFRQIRICGGISMTKNTMIFIFLNMIYLLIWYATNKIRSTKVGKELDSGFEFYNSLNNSDKENYWKEDTKILNLFFVFFIISMDISVLLLFNENNLWIFSLVVGLIISSVVAIILSINLRKKYK